MTREELGKIPFEWVSHRSFTDRYISISRNKEYGIELYKVTKRKGKFNTGKIKRIFYFKGKEYKSADSLLEAINNNGK